MKDLKIQQRDGTSKKKETTNIAHASHFFAHFFAVFARLQRENALFRV